jgi:hypothetical protein
MTKEKTQVFINGEKFNEDLSLYGLNLTEKQKKELAKMPKKEREKKITLLKGLVEQDDDWAWDKEIREMLTTLGLSNCVLNELLSKMRKRKKENEN